MKENYVDRPEELDALCRELRQSPFVAIDTEFLREKTYYAQLCLIQVANRDLAACIDPLALERLDPLLDVLYDSSIVKVLHSARQDLEILHDLCGKLPRPVFDTQIAATLAGFGDQAGFSTVVHKLLGASLDKRHTRTDWSHRPLDVAQIRYALDDVRYLVPVYERLRNDLERRGRLDWLEEDFANLSDSKQYQLPAEEAWRRLRGTRSLHGAQRAALRALAAWREEQARARNMPRKWILSDDALLSLARILPDDPNKLGRIRGLDAGVMRRFGHELLGRIQCAQAEPKERWPQRDEQGTRPTPQQEAISDVLMAVVRLRAAEHRVSTAALVNRKDLDALALGHRDAAVLHGWRAALVGKELLAVLAGEAALRICNGSVQIEPVD